MRRLAVALVVAAVTLGVGVPAASAAKWQRAVDLSGGGVPAWTPMAGMDGRGGAVAAWYEAPLENNRVMVEKAHTVIAARAPGRRFAKGTVLPEEAAVLKDLAVGRDGTAALVYQRVGGGNCPFFCPYATRLVVRDADGKLSKPIKVSSAATGPKVAVDGRGRVTVAWGTADAQGSRILVAERQPDGNLSAPVEVADDNARDPLLAVNSRGDAVVAWISHVMGQSSYLRMSYRRARGRWSSPATAGGAFDGKVAISDSGAAAVAYAVNGDTRVAYHDGRGRFSRASIALPAGGLYDLEMDRDGNVLVLGSQQTCTMNCPPGGVHFLTLATTRSARTGRWTAPHQVGGPDGQADAAYDGRGTAFALVNNFNRPDVPPGQFATTMPRGGVFGPLRSLADDASTFDGKIDVNDNGQAIAVWTSNVPGAGITSVALRD